MVAVFAYYRYSDDSQTESDSINRQRSYCTAMAERHGWPAPIEMQDEAKSGWTGENLERGELGKFTARVRSGEIEANSILIVEKLDRIGRLEADDAFDWFWEMTKRYGLRIATAMDNEIYDREAFRSSKGIALFKVFNGQGNANDYSSTISDRVKASFKERRKRAARGEVMPNSKMGLVMTAKLPGWLEAKVVDGVRRPVLREDGRLDALQMMYEMSAEGVGSRSIVKALNAAGHEPWGKAWCHVYVQEVLQSSAVEGDYEPVDKHGRKTGERITGYFPRAIEPDLVARARTAMGSRRGKGGRGKGSVELKNLFAGCLACGHCMGAMRLVGSSKNPAAYLVCNAAQNGRCEQRQAFKYKPFEEAALDSMLHLALDERFFQRPDETRKLANDLAEMRKVHNLKLDAAMNLGRQLAAKDSPILRELFDQAEAEVSALQAQVDELDKALQLARGAVSPAEHMARVLEVRGSLTHPDHATRIAARRKVIAAVKSVTQYVEFTVLDGDRKQIELALLAGTYAARFDDAGNKLGEVGVPIEVAAAEMWTAEGRATIADISRRMNA